MQPKILLVEDNPEVCCVVRSALKDWELVSVGNIGDARTRVKDEDFDLLILDVNLPDEDGFEFCEELGGGAPVQATPVFFLTGRSELSEKLRGFSLGADDYITKPFDPLELRARVQACIRRREAIRSRQNIFQKGALRFSLPIQKVEVEDHGGWRDLDLSSLEFKILVYLSQHEGQVVGRDRILGRIWGDSADVMNRTIDSHVSRLRKALHGTGYAIRAVYGAGYRFGAVGQHGA